MPTSRKQPMSQKRHMPVWLVVLVLACVAAGVVVYYYIQQPRVKQSGVETNTTSSTNTTQTPADGTTQTPTDKRIFKIPELGIQMTLAEGLEYEVKTDSTTKDIFISFNAELLKKADQACIRYGSIGGIMKSTDQAGISSRYANIKEISGYYYGFQDPCNHARQTGQSVVYKYP